MDRREPVSFSRPFPPEILLHALRHLPARDLVSVCLASRQFGALGTIELYRVLEISFRATDDWGAMGEIERRAEVAPLVKTVSVLSYVGYNVLDRLAAVWPRLSNLRRLEASNSNPEAQNVVVLPACSSLRSVCLNCDVTRGLVRWLTLFENIRSLTLAAWWGAPEDAVPNYDGDPQELAQLVEKKLLELEDLHCHTSVARALLPGRRVRRLIAPNADAPEGVPAHTSPLAQLPKPIYLASSVDLVDLHIAMSRWLYPSDDLLTLAQALPSLMYLAVTCFGKGNAVSSLLPRPCPTFPALRRLRLLQHDPKSQALFETAPCMNWVAAAGAMCVHLRVVWLGYEYRTDSGAPQRESDSEDEGTTESIRIRKGVGGAAWTVSRVRYGPHMWERLPELRDDDDRPRPGRCD